MLLARRGTIEILLPSETLPTRFGKSVTNKTFESADHRVVKKFCGRMLFTILHSIVILHHHQCGEMDSLRLIRIADLVQLVNIIIL